MANRVGARGIDAYYQTQVRTQSPLELVVLMYDGALRFMRAAADAMRRRDLVAKAHAMSRSMAIMGELQNSLNLTDGGDVAASLDELYRYITQRLVEANVSMDAAKIDEAIRLLTPLREAWAHIAAPGAGVQPQAQL